MTHSAHYLRALLAPVLTAAAMAASNPAPQSAPHPLVWDAAEKSIDTKSGDESARFEFSVTNKSANPVEILHIRTSCGCTVAEMPSTPWLLEPGASGSFSAVMDIKGKHGKFSKSVYVNSTAGLQTLLATANIPDNEADRRGRNQQLALVNRQAVFRGDCAACHVLPTIGKTGAELFQAACGICHLANPRASMVPDLMAVREPRDAAYWQQWISEGKEQTLMPGFGQKRGGPLTPEQISSLVEYLMKHLPTEPQPKN